MKKTSTFIFLLICANIVSAQNAVIDIKITGDNSAVITLTSGGVTKQKLNEVDLSDGNGKIVVTNQTINDVSVTFKKSDNTMAFKIPGTSIGKKATAGAADVVATFTIAASGALTPAVPNGIITPQLGFNVQVGQNQNVASVGATQAPPPPPANILDAVTSTKLTSYVEKQITQQGYHYVGGQNNLIIDDHGTVHIYLDENGSPIYTYFPVSAKENYDKFQLHILSTKNLSFTVSSTGEFNPTEIKDEISTNLAKAQSDGSAPEAIVEFKSPIFGPYTRLFPVTIYRKGADGNKLILDKSIRLLKTSRVSLNTGVVSTWLRSPQNISTFIKPNGDTTLIADDPNVRGYLALMLTFHLRPRNLNIQPRNAMERLGFSIGTNLSANAFDNFFAGLNVEITNGLFLNGGVHFGRVESVVNYPDSFKYGEDTFSGILSTRKKWNVGPYLAINVDAGLFAKVFKNILTPAQGNAE